MKTYCQEPASELEQKLAEGKNLNEEDFDKETSVIQEQIKPWHKRKFKKIMSVIGFSLLAGIIFGVAARFVFKYSDSIISKIFGLNQPYDTPYNQQSPVSLNPSAEPDKGKPENNGITIGKTDKDKEPSESGKNIDIKVSESDGTALTEYKRAMEEMRYRAEKVRNSIVSIEAVTNIVNWLGESIEQSENSKGIIVTENPNELFILTYYDKVKNADRIEISLKSGIAYTASLFNYDTSYNLAVLILPKQSVKQEDMKEISLIDIGDSDGIYAGMPIMAIGTTDGKNNTLEYGNITGDDFVEYITDSAIELFTTNVEHSDNGEGVVADLDGKVVGIITRKIGSGMLSNVNKCIRVNSLIKVAEKLCNGGSRLYLGITAENIPSWALRENDIENGIYVTGVEASSPASDAGIRKGDFITAVNGIKISDVGEFSDLLMGSDENSELAIQIFRVSKASEPNFSITVKPIKRNN